jgi:hypothetical protein
MDRALLEKPFSPDLVRTRKGAFGEVMYVEAAHYLRRLNEAFESQWSWKVLHYDVRDSEVLVHGALTAGSETKEAFGGSSITVNRSTGEVVSVADDLKSAATDALKKCCSLFGVGLDINSPADETPPADTRPSSALRSVPRNGPSPTSDAGATDRSRLTARQLKAIYAIGHGVGHTDGDIKKMSIEAYGVAPEFLTRADASSFINALSSK